MSSGEWKHYKDRTQAHILVCFLALAMWRTLQQWMKASGLGTAPRKLLEEMKEIKSLDVLLPTRWKNIRLRVVASHSIASKIFLPFRSVAVKTSLFNLLYEAVKNYIMKRKENIPV